MRVVGANTLTTTLTTLVAGRSYQVQVRAVSSVEMEPIAEYKHTGNGAYSSVESQLLNRVPSAVGTPSVTRVVVSGRPALRVSWTKPQSDLLITKYDVQYRQSGTTGWSTVDC
jgi:hypothetical protein